MLHVTAPEIVFAGACTLNETDVANHPFALGEVCGETTGGLGPVASNLNMGELPVLCNPAGSVHVVDSETDVLSGPE